MELVPAPTPKPDDSTHISPALGGVRQLTGAYLSEAVSLAKNERATLDEPAHPPHIELMRFVNGFVTPGLVTNLATSRRDSRKGRPCTHSLSRAPDDAFASCRRTRSTGACPRGPFQRAALSRSKKIVLTNGTRQSQYVLETSGTKRPRCSSGTHEPRRWSRKL